MNPLLTFVAIAAAIIGVLIVLVFLFFVLLSLLGGAMAGKQPHDKD